MKYGLLVVLIVVGILLGYREKSLSVIDASTEKAFASSEILALEEKVKAEALTREEKEEVSRLLDEGLDFISKREYRQALATFEKVLVLDPTSEEARYGIEKTKKVIFEEEEKEDYFKKVELYDLEQNFFNNEGEVLTVIRFKLKNKGDRALKRVQVTVYLKDSDRNIIADEVFYPIAGLATAAPITEPLKPGYTYQLKANKWYIINPPEKPAARYIEAKVTDIEFGYLDRCAFNKKIECDS